MNEDIKKEAKEPLKIKNDLFLIRFFTSFNSLVFLRRWQHVDKFQIAFFHFMFREFKLDELTEIHVRFMTEVLWLLKTKNYLEERNIDKALFDVAARYFEIPSESSFLGEVVSKYIKGDIS